MATLVIGTNFVAGTVAKASEINGNFSNIVSWSTTLDVDNFATLTGELDFLVGTTKAVKIVNNGTANSIDVLSNDSSTGLVITDTGTNSSVTVTKSGQLAAGKAIILITDAVAQVNATAAVLKMALSSSATIPAVDIAHGSDVTFKLYPTHLTIPSRTTVQKDAIVAPLEGSVIYDSTRKELQVRTNTLWIPTGSSTGFKNRIINGGMNIDQRNEGALLNNPVSRLFSVDRFSIDGSIVSKFKATRTPSTTETGYAVRVAAGFPNYLELESLSAYSLGANEYYLLAQTISSNNFSDMAFGTASAQTVTLSFLVNSSLTGNFGGAFINETGTRSYPFSYTVNSANTWETKTITIPGDTTGTWNMAGGTGIGAGIRFSMGASGTYTGTVNTWGTANAMGPSSGMTHHVNTSGAKLRITGIQLEKGSNATAFDFRSHQTEFDLCRYYYNKSYQLGTAIGTNTFLNSNVSVAINSGDFYDYGKVKFSTVMRTGPSITIYSGTGAAGTIYNLSASANQGTANVRYTGTEGYGAYCSAMTTNNAFSWHHTADAEH